MNTPLSRFVVGTLVFLPALAADDQIDDWQAVELGHAGDLTVRLRVKPQPSLADRNWLAIEFDNTGDQDIQLESASYRIDSVRHDLKTGDQVSSGSLASGNDHALFPDAWKTVPVSPRLVKPGVYRMIDHPSLYSAALLGLPGENGLLVKAEVFVDLRIRNELVRLAGKFQFPWRYPQEAEFEQMRARLQHLLAHPRDAVQHAYILHTLLEIPEVAQAISKRELIAAIGPRTHSFSGREYVLRYLNEHYADDELVVDYFAQRLRGGDRRIVADLRTASQVWQASFLTPLMERFESDRGSVDDVFVILRLRGEPQKTDPTLAQRLSAALLKHGYWKKFNREDPDQPFAAQTLAHGLTLMGQTHDRNMVARLMPYLDDQTPTIDPRMLSFPGVRLPPLRVCDSALEAILTILDGDPSRAYQQAGLKKTNNFAMVPQQAAEITTIRDKMIVTVKQRLAEDESK